MLPGLLNLLWAISASAYVVQDGNKCELYPESLNNNGDAVDDSPSILQAFENCGQNGEVIFTNNTFYINSVLNTTNLVNCDVSVRGELQFSTDIDYWRDNVYSVVFQNQSTAWLFGGENVTFRSEEGGWINGNGQTWYTWAKGTSNIPGRPITITFFNSTNLWVDGLNITQPQFWATLVWQSYNVSLTNLYVNATSNDGSSVVNTDGYDSWQSDLLLVENADITNGDDCIAAKGNTSNLLVRNVTCHEGSNGITIGSIGQYPDTPDYVQNVTFDNVRCLGCLDGAFIKTWSGTPVTTDSNGDAGGGGTGLVKNVTYSNFYMENVGLPIQISQCIYAEANGSGCNTSTLQIEDVSWINITGTSQFNIAASMYCSDAAPCPGIKFDNVSIQSVNQTLGLPAYGTDQQDEVFQCANLIDQDSTGIPCNLVAPDNYGQIVSSNVQAQ
ncbi:uncharacterized protein TRUGW13939_11951 [Talaromyces rugulosus]|uniref:galacturonan 1,4-alpha-galacturonidase n=1 Tax=Talaromyces rugulosus TaxID=121627 RepID=A0A7H8RGV2_TALRU|nr:uncharacterized protein TRUGW13939_11951 [Talaromyces rugulosus]QKX64775.1 hypothetical protein TRUGW13939_11951 [Talaromyces rugulosus]